MRCVKQTYQSEAEAEAALADLVAVHRKTGLGGKSWKRLVVYRCPFTCGGFHIGRDSTQRLQKMAEITNSKPAKKIPTLGQLKRRLRRIDEKLLKEQRHRAYVWGQIIERDRQRDYEEALACIYGSVPKLRPVDGGL